MGKRIQTALISAANKEALGDLGTFLFEQGVRIISTGGSAKVLEEYGVEVVPVEEISGNPEAFDGRVKTLSFFISAGLLFRRGHDDEEAQKLGVGAIDLVVCNFYPFEEAWNKGAAYEELIEYVDIGGPTMVRASAKNGEEVAVLTSPGQYASFKEAFLKNKGVMPLEFNRSLAKEAFYYTAQYEMTIARGLAAKTLRYGENPHQKSWVLGTQASKSAWMNPLQGKELSYNNLLDGDAALRCLKDLHCLSTPNVPAAAVVVKHTNPCGAAISTSSIQALTLAFAGDPVSAFGSIVALNTVVGKEEAVWLREHFVEVILALDYSVEAMEVFRAKKNLRLLRCSPALNKNELVMRSIEGGYLIQEEAASLQNKFREVTQKAFPAGKEKLLAFGQTVVKHLKSNAIVLVAESTNGSLEVVGAGMGNPNRLESLKQACNKALENKWEDLSGVLLVSDAFFPFRDTVEWAHNQGIVFICQPGGAMRDQEIIQCCDELGISMVFTGERLFRH